MAYRSRYARRVVRKSRRNLIISILLIAFLLYATLQWLLPNFIGGISFIKSKISPPPKVQTNITSDTVIAPPVLNIPYEATNSAVIDIHGYASPHSNITIFLDDEKIDTTQAQDDGTFEITNVHLNLGTNNIYGQASDQKNNQSLPSKTIQVIFNDKKPSLEISNPQDNQTIQGGDKKITISGKTDPEAQILVNGDQVVVDKDGNFSDNVPLNDGDNTFTIRATDRAGNYTEIQRKVTYKSS